MIGNQFTSNATPHKISLVLLLCSLFVSTGMAHAPNPNIIGQISFLLGKLGDIQIRHENGSDWIPAKLKMKIQKGDRIQTKRESRCEVNFQDGSLIRIGEDTVFDFEQSTIKIKDRQFEASLFKGKIWANIVSLIFGKEEKFSVKSPTAVCAVRGTIYRMESDSTTRVAVYDGEVNVGPSQGLQQQYRQQQQRPGPPTQVPGPTEVPGPFEVSLEDWISIAKGQQIEVRGDGKYAVTQIDQQQEADDDWVKWNLQRERELDEQR